MKESLRDFISMPIFIPNLFPLPLFKLEMGMGIQRKMRNKITKLEITQMATKSEMDLQMITSTV